MREFTNSQLAPQQIELGMVALREWCKGYKGKDDSVTVGSEVWSRREIVETLEERLESNDWGHNDIPEMLLRVFSESYLSIFQRIEQFIEEADELSLTKMLVAPLFRAMGYESVRPDEHRDRRREFGQDIREIKFKLRCGHLLYFVAQVKKDLYVSNIQPVLDRLKMALEKEFFDYDVNLEVRADHVYLVIRGNISEDAREYLEERIGTEKRRNILILYREDLLRLYKQYGLPPEAQERIRVFMRDSQS